MAELLVAVNELTRTYREGDHTRRVLNGLNLEVARGEWVALLGHSGCGKSTLLNLISGIDTPSEGEVRIDGVNLTALNEKERTLFRRRHIGFIYQFFNLVPTLTLEENLLLPLELNRYAKTVAADKCVEWLEYVGLLDRRTSFPEQLSGGEQQRIAIARALIHDPLLVLADEPTGNLDAQTGSTVLQILERLTRKTGKSLILVSHSKQVSSRANRILTLANGKIGDQSAEIAW
jgi:putative ABC transport system ATP-binding protein